MHPTKPPAKPKIYLRDEIRADDAATIRRIVTNTGYFTPAEVGIAVELIEDRLLKGAASEYYFVFAEIDGSVAGYTCYGPIGCTVGSFDLYWIAVDPAWQGQGVGRQLVAAAEQRIHAMGGRQVYIETAGKDQYQSTREFYLRCGYTLEAVVKNFYDIGDDKLIYVRILNAKNAVEPASPR